MARLRTGMGATFWPFTMSRFFEKVAELLLSPYPSVELNTKLR